MAMRKSRRKRYIKGRVYITNDKMLVGGRDKKRRVVSMGNDKNNMAVRRISSLFDKNGKKKERLVVSWVQSEQEIETNTKQSKPKDPFDDCDI